MFTITRNILEEVFCEQIPLNLLNKILEKYLRKIFNF